jgi:hypothetical protein
VNLPHNGAAALLLVMLVALPARAAAPLVVGAVRDQGGVPISGASVEGRRFGAPPVLATTDSSGTFAIDAAGISSVVIRCRYCAAAQAGVREGEPVVVIVRRYAALASDAPNASDIESLPYANVESILGLRPFTLLAQSQSPYPGSRVSDRGLSPDGSLLVDDGSPNYDIVAGGSPYALIPAQFERSAALQPASNAFLYGDQAAGGIADLNPFVSDSNWQVASVGSDTIARAQVGSDAAGAVFGAFSNDTESRQRGDVSATWSPGGDQTLAFTGGSEQGRTFGTPLSNYAGSYSFVNATYANPQLENLYASAAVDRGNYTFGSAAYSAAAIWSDSNVLIGAHTSGAVSAFADLGLRLSTGLYDQQAGWSLLPSIGATLSQSRLDAGIHATGAGYDVKAGLGAFWIDYGGGLYGVSQPAKTTLAAPSLQAQLFPEGRWSLNIQGSGSFTLPTFLEQYDYIDYPPTSVQLERNELVAGALTYTDLSRVRVSFEEASQRVTGVTTGTITSAGLAATWQVTPELALRAWTMHVTDTVTPFVVAGYDEGSAPTVNAMWLTYEARSPLRFDLIYRRDLLDGTPFYHVDGDVSGPIAARLRWFAGVEDRMHRTFLDVGLRFGGQ